MIEEIVDLAIIGAGQAGLATAYCLKELGIDPLLLEAAPAIGTSWRNRYDSLKLFTPSQYSSLPGMRFPAPADHYPTKDEVADYLASYASAWALNVRTGTEVMELSRQSDHFSISHAGGTITARVVVVASGALQRPVIPAFAQNLSPSVLQLHSASYRNPEMISEGEILIVGGGNSGAQVAEELANARRSVAVSIGKMPRHLPQRFFGKDIFWWLLKGGLISTRPAKVVGSKATTPIPTIGTDLHALSRSGKIRLVPRVVGVDGDQVILDDQSRITPSTVIWATGFWNDFSWIDIDGATAGPAPLHERGVSPVNGLFFIGLPFLYSKGSAFLGFVEDDARYVAGVAAHVVLGGRV